MIHKGRPPVGSGQKMLPQLDRMALTGRVTRRTATAVPCRIAPKRASLCRVNPRAQTVLALWPNHHIIVILKRTS